MDCLNNVRNLCLHYLLCDEGELIMPESIDRSEVNRALSRAIAYKNAGQDRKAEWWARELVKLLGQSGILNPWDIDKPVD